MNVFKFFFIALVVFSLQAEDKLVSKKLKKCSIIGSEDLTKRVDCGETIDYSEELLFGHCPAAVLIRQVADSKKKYSKYFYTTTLDIPYGYTAPLARYYKIKTDDNTLYLNMKKKDFSCTYSFNPNTEVAFFIILVFVGTY